MPSIGGLLTLAYIFQNIDYLHFVVSQEPKKHPWCLLSPWIAYEMSLI